jgi:hypothetical protein
MRLLAAPHHGDPGAVKEAGMTHTRFTDRGRALAAIALTIALLTTFATFGRAEGNDGPRSSVAGVWYVQVTLRNCATNAALGSFPSLVTFHEGGTISETTSSPAFAIGQRSPAQGTWRSAGHRSYTQRMVALINFDTAPNLPGTPGFDPSLPVSPGFFAGWSIVTHTLTLHGQDRLMSSGGNEFYAADGTLYRTGCSTSEGTRFE